MKLIDKLAKKYARNFQSKLRIEQRINAFEAGFRKAREMCQERANGIAALQIREGQDENVLTLFTVAISDLGEEEV